MPNVLVLSLESFSFSSRQMYQQLLPKLLSRAAVHESCTIEDALNYISSGWPSIILVSDSVIAQGFEDSNRLLDAVYQSTRNGCITVFMGFFAGSVEFDRLNQIFQDRFGLPWKARAYTSHQITLLPNLDINLIRPSGLAKQFDAKALYLGYVPRNQVVYSTDESRGRNESSVYAAIARIELGKLGYIGDVNFEEEPEKLILAMCHLDRPEDWIEEESDVDSDIGREY